MVKITELKGKWVECTECDESLLVRLPYGEVFSFSLKQGF